MFILVEKYAVDVRRQHFTQAIIRLDGRTAGFFGAESRSFTIYLRFREWWDQLRHEVTGHREPAPYDSYPGEGFVKTTPIIAYRENEIGVDLPYRDFERMYHILQTEAPIYAHWEPDSHEDFWDAPATHRFFALATMAEPVGEGPSDEDES